MSNFQLLPDGPWSLWRQQRATGDRYCCHSTPNTIGLFHIRMFRVFRWPIMGSMQHASKRPSSTYWAPIICCILLYLISIGLPTQLPANESIVACVSFLFLLFVFIGLMLVRSVAIETAPEQTGKRTMICCCVVRMAIWWIGRRWIDQRRFTLQSESSLNKSKIDLFAQQSKQRTTILCSHIESLCLVCIIAPIEQLTIDWIE